MDTAIPLTILQRNRVSGGTPIRWPHTSLRPLPNSPELPKHFVEARFRGMLDPSAIVRREKLYLMQRYDPNRIPLLMVHGLIRRRFLLSICVTICLPIRRFMPDTRSGTTTIALALRCSTMPPSFAGFSSKRLSMLDPSGRDFATNHLVVLGHSMGGIMAHTLICDSEYKLWDSVITVGQRCFAAMRRPAACSMPSTCSSANTRIRRAILISVPHRGSSVADNWIGNLGQSLYRADRELQEAFRSMVEEHLDQINPFFVKLMKEGKLSSIRTLSANSPALMALAAIPPAIPFHSIIGQNKSRTRANRNRRRGRLCEQPSRRRRIRNDRSFWS